MNGKFFIKIKIKIVTDMQFKTQEKVDTKIVSFDFFDKLPLPAKLKFGETFRYLGATQIRGTRGGWIFPIYVTSHVIQTIIRNTCFVCGGLMEDSTAFQNSNVSFTDFGDDTGSKGTTQSKVGPAQQIKVRKCTACGHSHI